MKYLAILLSFVFLSCGGSHPSTKASKDFRDGFKTLQKLIKNRKFKIVFEHASPQTSNSLNQVANKLNLSAKGSNASYVDLTGDSYYFKQKADTVAAFLPFYGERYSGNSLDVSGVIEFKGVPKNYTLTENKVKHHIRIEFSIADKKSNSGHYKISLQFFANHKTQMHVSGSQRSGIDYYGKVEEVLEN